MKARGLLLHLGWLLVLGASSIEPIQAQPAPSDANQAIDEAAVDGPWMDGVSVDQQTAARTIFLEANELIREAFFADAANKYKEALEIWDHPAFHFNLAMAQRALDQRIAAYWSLRKAMSYGEAPLGESKFEHAKRVRDLLSSQLSHIEVVCNDEGAEVTIDGKLLFVGPGSRKTILRPGDHQIVAAKKNRIPDTKSVKLEPGKKQRFELSLRTADRIEVQRRWPVWMPYAVVGASVAFFAGGGYFDRQSSQNFSEFDGQFDGLCNQGCPESQLAPEVRDTLDTAKTQQNVARVIYTVGGAVLVTGVVMLYLNQEKAVRVQGGKESNVAVTPYVTPGGAGVNAGFRF